jgi:hypothetical protein
VVVRVLNALVDSVFKVADDRVVVSNDVSIFENRCLDASLLSTEIFNHKAKTGIDWIVLLELFVHRTSTVPQIDNFELFGGDVLSQISDFFVKYKLEFFELLSLFL